MAGGGGFEAPEAFNKRQKKYQRGKKIGVRIDMTPMVDVIMLLLTFFMLTTTLATPQVMQINLPKGEKDDLVKVDATNVLYIREISTSPMVLLITRRLLRKILHCQI